MTHFLLYTPVGSLLIVLAASAVVAFLVWCAVVVAVSLTAFALWRLGSALHERLTARLAPRPHGRRHG